VEPVGAVRARLDSGRVGHARAGTPPAASATRGHGRAGPARQQLQLGHGRAGGARLSPGRGEPWPGGGGARGDGRGRGRGGAGRRLRDASGRDRGSRRRAGDAGPDPSVIPAVAADGRTGEALRDAGEGPMESTVDGDWAAREGHGEEIGQLVRKISERRGRQGVPGGTRVALLNHSLHRFDQLLDRSGGVGNFMTMSTQKCTRCKNHTG
jgi:hypothetical protein